MNIYVRRTQFARNNCFRLIGFEFNESSMRNGMEASLSSSAKSLTRFKPRYNDCKLAVFLYIEKK